MAEQGSDAQMTAEQRLELLRQVEALERATLAEETRTALAPDDADDEP